jgi:lipopolysaccharide/colanic/teichoic acid biosynthesis glycosyltransferase
MRSGWRRVLKRSFDVAAAALALIVLSPLFLIIGVAIKLHDRGPIFYRGERVGVGGKRFRILKFRTMVVNAERLGGSSTPKDDPRVTPVGRMLRAVKLDELPQLLNVLGGDMSLVGPRPRVAWAVALYSKDEQELLSVRPGITDYASIRFRNEAEILRGSRDPDRDYLEKIAPEKLRLGLLYVRDGSFLTDLRILIATAVALVGGDANALLGLPPAGDPQPVKPRTPAAS